MVETMAETITVGATVEMIRLTGLAIRLMDAPGFGSGASAYAGHNCYTGRHVGCK